MKNVFVLGSGRSGTSLAAGLLSGAGYFMGDNLMPPTPGNPKGYYESFDIERINEDILQKVIRPKPKILKFFYKRRPGKGQFWLISLDLNVNITGDASISERIHSITQKTPYCFKDPRFCYTLPVWKPHMTSNTVFLCVFRHPAETASSILTECHNEPYLSDFACSFSHAITVWKQMYSHIVEIHRTGKNWLFIHYQQLLNYEGQNRIKQFTGAEIDRSFPDSQLNRSKPGKKVPAETEELYKKLCRLAEYGT